MVPRTRTLRRHFRRVKALRRLREDRNQHYRDLACLCWGTRVTPTPIHERASSYRYGTTIERRIGRTWSMFADTPKACSSPAHGCGNPRRYAGSRKERLTIQELREALVADE
jgi:hypothetical protein